MDSPVPTHLDNPRVSSTMTTPPSASADTLGIRPRSVDQLCVDTIRMLAVDMVNAANSGHPGMPMGCADLAYVLFTEHLRFDPAAPGWRARDRFVLSAGHGSALLYALLHLSGYDLSLDDLRAFRQLGSRTPGHPERGVTAGVEVTTGPLGQGISNAVGIALAQRMLSSRFDAPGRELNAHRTFVLASDGDLMEGVSSEACSLAGHWQLGDLIVLYDANSISIDGSTDLSFTEDVARRYEAYGWHVATCDGHDRAAVSACLSEAVAVTGRPSLIVCHTRIGKGSPNREGKETSHGSPLGADETRLTKDAYGWPHEPTFLVPDEVLARFRSVAAAGRAAREEWDTAVASWAAEDQATHAAWDAHWDRDLPSAQALLRDVLAAGLHGADATRKHSGRVLNVLAKRFPNLVGGSADLAGSNNTDIKGSPFVGAAAPAGGFTAAEFRGSNLHFGVREHAMGAIANGLDAHGSFMPFVATFLGFLDYMRPPVRLAALSHHGLICVYTHDSIGLGEDGPTHQPIEHLWTARVTPGVHLHRPADFRETAAAWAHAVSRRDGPTLLALTRQTCPDLDRGEGFDETLLLRGAYVLRAASNEAAGRAPAVILIATGSEVGLALGARERLEAYGTPTRVVSMPSVEIFDAQDGAYRASVLPEGPRRVAIEAGRGDGWYRFVGRDGLVIGIDTFGASGPAKELFAQFGFTPEAIADRVRRCLPG